MSQFSARLKKKNFQKYPRFSTWSRIFFRYIIVFTYFPNCGTFIYSHLVMTWFSEKSEKLFWAVGRSGGRSLPLAFGSRLFWFWGFCQVGGVAVRYCKRLPYSVIPLSLLYPLALMPPPLSHWPPQLSLPSLLGALDLGTERARLVVQVERLRYTRLRHRTCKTSRSSKKASHPASAQNVQD